MRWRLVLTPLCRNVRRTSVSKAFASYHLPCFFILRKRLRLFFCGIRKRIKNRKAERQTFLWCKLLTVANTMLESTCENLLSDITRPKQYLPKERQRDGKRERKERRGDKNTFRFFCHPKTAQTVFFFAAFSAFSFRTVCQVFASIVVAIFSCLNARLAFVCSISCLTFSHRIRFYFRLLFTFTSSLWKCFSFALLSSQSIVVFSLLNFFMCECGGCCFRLLFFSLFLRAVDRMSLLKLCGFFTKSSHVFHAFSNRTNKTRTTNAAIRVFTIFDVVAVVAIAIAIDKKRRGHILNR